MNAPELILDGVKLPTPTREGIAITPNRIWSENAGRNTATGKMVGDIIAVKYTVSVTYSQLSDEEMQLIFDLLSAVDPWRTLRFPLKDGTRAMICYAADPTYVMRQFDMHKRCPYYSGVTLEFIEQ